MVQTGKPPGLPPQTFQPRPVSCPRAFHPVLQSAPCLRIDATLDGSAPIGVRGLTTSPLTSWSVRHFRDTRGARCLCRKVGAGCIHPLRRRHGCSHHLLCREPVTFSIVSSFLHIYRMIFQPRANLSS